MDEHNEELLTECPKCHKPYQARSQDEKERVEKYGCIICNAINRGEHTVICSKDNKPCDKKYRPWAIIFAPSYKCRHTKKTELGYSPPDNWLFGTCVYMDTR